MATKKTTEALQKADYDKIMREARALLNSLAEKEEPTKAEEKKIDMLSSLLALLGKMPAQRKKKVTKPKAYDAKKDEEIVARFVERLKKSAKF